MADLNSRESFRNSSDPVCTALLGLVRSSLLSLKKIRVWVFSIFILSSFFTFIYKGQTPTLMHPLYHTLAYGQQEILFLWVPAWGTKFIFLQLVQKIAHVTICSNIHRHTYLYIIITSMKSDHNGDRKCNAGNIIHTDPADKEPPEAGWFKRLLSVLSVWSKTS